MASITKRKGGWCDQVRRKGYEARNRTFPTKSAALKWGREQEALMDRGSLPLTVAPLKGEKVGGTNRTISPDSNPSQTQFANGKPSAAPHGQGPYRGQGAHRPVYA